MELRLLPEVGAADCALPVACWPKAVIMEDIRADWVLWAVCPGDGEAPFAAAVAAAGSVAAAAVGSVNDGMPCGVGETGAAAVTELAVGVATALGCCPAAIYTPP